MLAVAVDLGCGNGQCNSISTSNSTRKVVLLLPALKCMPDNHRSFTSKPSRRLDAVRIW